MSSTTRLVRSIFNCVIVADVQMSIVICESKLALNKHGGIGIAIEIEILLS